MHNKNTFLLDRTVGFPDRDEEKAHEGNGGIQQA